MLENLVVSLVYPRTGRCWCEADSSETCRRYKNGYKRFDFIQGEIKDLKVIEVDRVLSWQDADKLAEQNGGRLPTKDELAIAKVNTPSLTCRGSFDFWHPVSRVDGKKNDGPKLVDTVVVDVENTVRI